MNAAALARHAVIVATQSIAEEDIATLKRLSGFYSCKKFFPFVALVTRTTKIPCAGRRRQRRWEGEEEGSSRRLSRCAVFRPCTVTISRPLASVRARVYASELVCALAFSRSKSTNKLGERNPRSRSPARGPEWGADRYTLDGGFCTSARMWALFPS